MLKVYAGIHLISLIPSLQVLAFGSVPLKTYLPDGDVDLTAFCYQSLTEVFAREVCNVLKSEEGPEFRIKDIQYIDAQVFLS